MCEALKGISVIGIGQACFDYLGRLESFPCEDQKAELSELHAQSGGPASTALVALARLGIKTSFLGSVSDDFFGREIIKALKKENVDRTFLKMTPGYTSQVAFIAITKGSGNRTVFWHRGSVPHLRAEDVDLSPFSGAAILHTDGLMIEATLEAARQAKKLGIKVVLDAGTRRDGSRDLLSRVDVLIASQGFVESFTEPGRPSEKALKALGQLGPADVIMTMGSAGSIGWNRDGCHIQRAFPVDVMDTTGAGDVYHGGYVYGLLQGWEMAACMRFASAVAAIKCKKIGARQGIPTIEEVEAFLKHFSDD